MPESPAPSREGLLDEGFRSWSVSALVRAMADTLEARFNPVSVHGEISGWSRASSGHCYFSLKDEAGQIRCALFKRAASLLDFTPRDGQKVRARGRLSIYEPRGEVQLVVESLRLDGQGALFERFVQIKARLEAQGLFDGARKRALPLFPRAIGVVTSLGAAALQDVLTTLRRRAPHCEVVIYPATVQGEEAPVQLQAALQRAYQRAEVDVLLLVRGGGALEDLWAFNDENLARLIVQSPMPLVSGVGHETDFTIVDFCADLRAATPTAAAEMAVHPQAQWLLLLQGLEDRLMRGQQAQLDRHGQRLDRISTRWGRPAQALSRAQASLAVMAQRLDGSARMEGRRQHLDRLAQALPRQLGRAGAAERMRIEALAGRLKLLDPQRVLERGYSWLTDRQGQTLSSVAQARDGQALQATLADGKLSLRVTSKADPA